MFVKILPFIWLGAAVLFFIGEMISEGFALMWFGIGAAVAAGLGFLDVYTSANIGIWWQLLAFAVISTALFAMSRTIFKRFTKDASRKGVAADRMIGKVGVVTEPIDPMTAKGMVRVDKEDWRAESEDDKPVQAGARVEVMRLEGVRLVVKIKEE